tara:strand:- start:92 stop:286 length:195 start_codon:yes stop_codon:yes gene_type:complete
MKYSMEKYKQNLKVDDFYVYSYGTKVAKIDRLNKEVIKLGWWSVTTSKHINYVAKALDFELVDQ